jgi:hypothetical protein
LHSVVHMPKVDDTFIATKKMQSKANREESQRILAEQQKFRHYLRDFERNSRGRPGPDSLTSIPPMDNSINGDYREHGKNSKYV